MLLFMEGGWEGGGGVVGGNERPPPLPLLSLSPSPPPSPPPPPFTRRPPSPLSPPPPHFFFFFFVCCPPSPPSLPLPSYVDCVNAQVPWLHSASHGQASPSCVCPTCLDFPVCCCMHYPSQRLTACLYGSLLGSVYRQTLLSLRLPVLPTTGASLTACKRALTLLRLRYDQEREERPQADREAHRAGSGACLSNLRVTRRLVSTRLLRPGTC